MITRPVNKLFQVENIHEWVDVNNVNNTDNDKRHFSGRGEGA